MTIETPCPETHSSEQSVRARWLSWCSKGLFTLTDQGLIASSNFLISIVLARELSTAQYGAYALAFEIFLVLSMAYACLVLEPMLVLGASKYSDTFRQYFGVLLWMHFGIALVILGALGGSAWVIYGFGKSPTLSAALTSTTIALPWVLLFWLARRAFYVKLDPKTAVFGGLLYSIVLLGGVFAFYKLHLLSPSIAFLLMAAGAVAATPFLLARLRPVMVLKPKYPDLRDVARSHWIYGRWALAGAVASWVSGNIYYLLLSGIRGLSDAGELKALLNFASPVGQVFAALFTLTLPYVARVCKNRGTIAIERFSWFLTPLYASGAVAYWIAFYFGKDTIVHFLYAGKYSQLEYLIPYVAIGSIFRIATTAQSISLKGSQLPFLAFLAWVVSDVFACIVAVPAILVFGLPGALWAYALSGVASFVAGSWLVMRTVRRASRSLTGTGVDTRPKTHSEAFKPVS